jgi:hypothetical protein
MTPKEKAKELFDKYTIFQNGYGYEYKAKQCALIAVDEILKAIPSEYLDVWQGETNMVINEDVKYWERVKKEIKKL